MIELIKTLLADITRKAAPSFKSEILVKITENKNQGYYTSSVAFKLAKMLHKSPQLIAEELAKKLTSAFTKASVFAKSSADKSADNKEFSKIEAKNGFVNFFLSEECLHHQLKEILEKPFFAKATKGEKINIEFISANPTGPLTIGNGRGGFYGDALANVLETQGHKVIREYYINDRGEQIRNLGISIKIAQGEKMGPGSIKGTGLYLGGYIYDLAPKIKKGLNIEETGQKAVELVLKIYIKPILKRLGIKFDVWFSEKTLYPSSLKLRRASKGDYEKVLEDLMANDFVYEKDGATWMKTSELGDSEDRVLIKKDGNETYFLSDILYHFDKLKMRKFDKVIDIWGADHHGYAPRLKASLKILGVPPENLDIVIVQLIRLISGGKETKVSKRAGTFVTLEELIDEVGLDAARFFFLMYSNDTHMDFDMDLAKSRSAKNPVYYVQYAHARLCSILRKSEIKNPKSEKKSKSQISNYKLFTKNDFNLIRKLVEYPEILADISKNYEVHRLPRYVLELAREFHNFYEKERVITEDKKLTSARLALITATKIVLANTLNLMGIKTPDKM